MSSFRRCLNSQAGEACQPLGPSDPPVPTCPTLRLQVQTTQLFTWLLGMELKSLCLQGKHFTHWAISIPALCFKLFKCWGLCFFKVFTLL